jgi:hypothetical protein
MVAEHHHGGVTYGPSNMVWGLDSNGNIYYAQEYFP